MRLKSFGSHGWLLIEATQIHPFFVIIKQCCQAIRKHPWQLEERTSEHSLLHSPKLMDLKIYYYNS